MKPQVLFIVNPKSGTPHSKRWVRFAQRILSRNYEVDVVYTQRRGHGYELAVDAVKRGIHIVVAAGGDGTVNEVASALIGTQSVLGIFPSGSGNGLARELGYKPRMTLHTIHALRVGKTADIDFGYANGKPFFCTCGTGFDAEVANQFANNHKRGFWQYLKLCIKIYFGFEPMQCTLKKDDNSEEKREALVINCANIKQFGFGAQIAPKANVYDGLLNVTIVPNIGFWRALGCTIDLFIHQLHHNPAIESFTCKELNLSLPDSASFHIDGDAIDLGGNNQVNIKVGTGLKVIVP